MKNLFLLLGVITMLLASCQKTTIEPQAVVLPQQTVTPCSQYGACAEGWYKIIPVHNSLFDTVINTTGTTNPGLLYLKFIKYFKPVPTGINPDSLMYRFTQFTFNTNCVMIDSIHNTQYGIYNGPTSAIGLLTKSNKHIAVEFDHY